MCTSLVPGDIHGGVAADRTEGAAVTVLPLGLADLAVQSAAAAGAVHGLVVAAGTLRMLAIIAWQFVPADARAGGEVDTAWASQVLNLASTALSGRPRHRLSRCPLYCAAGVRFERTRV